MYSRRGFYGLLFVFFFLLKSSALHAYEHLNNEVDTTDHCYTCEIQQLQAPLLLTSQTEVLTNHTAIIVTKVSPMMAYLPLFKRSFYNQLWCRPPPLSS